jgi:sulfonate transport system substrate-binding protein
MLGTLRMQMIGVVALATGLLAGPGWAQAPIDLKIGAGTASDHAPGFVGIERGIFAKHGLNAKIIMYPTGVEMINGLMAGAQDVNLMGSIPFLAAISNGVPLVLIAHLHGDPLRPDYSTGHSIVAGPGTGIGRGDIKALKGKRIALPRGTGAEGYVLGHLRSTGMAVEEVQLINVKPADLPTALARRDVDAIAVWEPWPSTALVKVPGSVRVVDGGCATCYIPAAILTNRDTVAKKGEALRRFMVAFAESQQWVRQNFDGAAEIAMRWVPGLPGADLRRDAGRQDGGWPLDL